MIQSPMNVTLIGKEQHIRQFILYSAQAYCFQAFFLLLRVQMVTTAPSCSHSEDRVATGKSFSFLSDITFACESHI